MPDFNKAALSVVLLAGGLLGQNHVALSGTAAPSRAAASPSGRFSIGISGPSPFAAHRRGFRPNPLFFGWPNPYYYNGYDDYAGEPSRPAPGREPAPAPQTKPEPPAAPALMELQGNQWVKVQNFSMPSSAVVKADERSSTQLPPAILVFRDGHIEELRSYSIIGNIIYTKSDYWTSGFWTRTIAIADLDLDATLRRNHDRGLDFQLPTNPNEIMLRP